MNKRALQIVTALLGAIPVITGPDQCTFAGYSWSYAAHSRSMA